ncbi:flagellar hook-basal body complex protein [Clostridia bacterium OttesenSCG-928-F22]|nr:flagellar hook-basal body complex protein [Clostridia bacterium OttesenSCG-928-F22]
MRSLYSGITGLRNHQTKMDVIGNNIANVNTVGYKTSRVIFQDIYSQTLQSASGPQGANAGTNPRQIGLGVTLAAIDVMHTSAASQYTGNTFDLAIEGDGYFIIRTSGTEYAYSRAGNFGLTPNGTLASSDGLPVQCWNALYTKGAVGKANQNGWTNKLTDNNIFKTTGFQGDTQDVQATPTGTYSFTIDDTDPTDLKLTLKINGYERPLDNTAIKLYDKAAPATSLWSTNLTDDTKTYVLEIPELGNFEFQLEAGKTMNAVDLQKVLEEFTDILNATRITVRNNDGYNPGAAMGDLVVDESLYYNVGVDKSGAVSAIERATGEKVVLGYVALATFINPTGLEKAGGNLYVESLNSGQPKYTTAQNDAGKINPGALEMSNVDLATEFTDLITTQRGFQANSRTITTSDQMLEELVNLKR